MKRILVLLFIGITLAGIHACKSRKTVKSFSPGEAFSVSSADSQLVELKRQLPQAEISRVPKGIKVTFASGILFAVNASSLSSPAQEYLEKLAGVLQRHPAGRILIEGHTDITGTTDYNKTLSEKRAESVKTYLVNQGIVPDRINTAGYGEARPVATNSTPQGQEKNRRVELFIMP
ncbi:OmpA family protein [Anseongella ginsenosidimutans]|uniref:OmpA family protein n=1 Tax=Anseongella ginsenosidimutans TaxID=496056 RepID=A0A4R3KVK4_9SPHI|nr:OmpA family protein [Anseongella ginsenosidimutans]QEC51817.1 OmpA family protein [Anseongella ginsenosidimutans]TCS89188.1 OmpA family protein [Anseongella ginsenosidimutans]